MGGVVGFGHKAAGERYAKRITSAKETCIYAKEYVKETYIHADGSFGCVLVFVERCMGIESCSCIESLHACMYVCMHVCMYVCMYVRTYVWRVYIFVCIWYVCMYVCMYLCVESLDVCMCVCKYVCT